MQPNHINHQLDRHNPLKCNCYDSVTQLYHVLMDNLKKNKPNSSLRPTIALRSSSILWYKMNCTKTWPPYTWIQDVRCQIHLKINEWNYRKIDSWCLWRNFTVCVCTKTADKTGLLEQLTMKNTMNTVRCHHVVARYMFSNLFHIQRWSVWADNRNADGFASLHCDFWGSPWKVVGYYNEQLEINILARSSLLTVKLSSFQ